MKTYFVIAGVAGVLTFAHAGSAQIRTAADATGPAASGTQGTVKSCASCAQKAPEEVFSTQPIPGTNETMLVGRIENLMPIGVLAALGCEACVGRAVAWALQQGSSADDVERALRTIAAMQKLDCFKQQFGPDAATRLEKPLAAARRVLQQALDPAAKQLSPASSKD